MSMQDHATELHTSAWASRNRWNPFATKSGTLELTAGRVRFLTDKGVEVFSMPRQGLVLDLPKIYFGAALKLTAGGETAYVFFYNPSSRGVGTTIAMARGRKRASEWAQATPLSR
jgi:hypothetical protein